MERRDLALTVGDYDRTASIFNLLSAVAGEAFRVVGAKTRAGRLIGASMSSDIGATASSLVVCQPKTSITSLRRSCLTASSLAGVRIRTALYLAAFLGQPGHFLEFGLRSELLITRFTVDHLLFS